MGEGRVGVLAHPSERRHLAGAVSRARQLRRNLTDAERRLWSRLRAQNLHFRRQAPIGRYIVDFVQHDSRVIVELDGGHDAEPGQEIYDAERTAWLQLQGYRVLRFWNAEVLQHPDAVVDAIVAAVTKAQA